MSLLNKPSALLSHEYLKFVACCVRWQSNLNKTAANTAVLPWPTEHARPLIVAADLRVRPVQSGPHVLITMSYMTLKVQSLVLWRTAHAPCCWACLCFDAALCRRCDVNRYSPCKSGRAVSVSSETERLFQHESIPRRSLTDLSACSLAAAAISLSLCPLGAHIHLLRLRPPSQLSLPVDLSVCAVWICFSLEHLSP